MSLPKLIKITQALDTKQCSDLKKFVLYYIGHDSDLFQILEAIIKHQSKMNDGDDVDAFAKKHFPNCTKKTFMNYLSQLYGYTEDWIAHHQLKENEYQKDLLVQQWLNKRGLYQLSDIVVNKVRKEIDNENRLDINRARVKADLLFEHFFSNHPVKYTFDIASFSEMAVSLNTYTAGINFLFLSELYSWGFIGNKNISSIKEFILSCQPNNLIAPEIEVAEHLSNVFSKNDVPSYLFISQKLLNHEFVETSKFHAIIASAIISKSSKYHSTGRYLNHKLITDLAEYGLKTGVYFTNGKLPTAIFHNLVIKLCLYQSFNEVLNFIEQWISKVYTEDIIATKNLALAQLHFYNNQFDQIDILIRRNEFDNFNQKNIAQSIFLCSTFINRKQDPEKYNIAFLATVNFIKRNKSKMSSDLYATYQNFFKILRLLEKNQIKNIKELEDYKPIMYQRWIQFVLEKNERG